MTYLDISKNIVAQTLQLRASMGICLNYTYPLSYLSEHIYLSPVGFGFCFWLPPNLPHPPFLRLLSKWITFPFEILSFPFKTCLSWDK